MPKRRNYSTELLKNYLENHGIGAMDLVRQAGISVSTAYRIVNGEDLHSLDVFYDVYVALRKSNRDISWENILDLL